MEKLYSLFQDHTVYVILSILGIIGGIISVVTGWSQFYKILSSRITVSGWTIFLTFLFFTTAFLGLSISKSKSNLSNKKLEPIIGKDFGHEAVNIDGKSFERCKFFSTQLVFSGEQLFSLKECQFDLTTSFYFAGDASITVQGLRNIYRDPILRPQVDQVIQDIKAGDLNFMPKSRTVE